MPINKKLFNLTFDKIGQMVDVDDSAGRSVPINMNFIDEGYLTKDTGYELFGAIEASLCHSLFHYKKKNGTSYIIRGTGTKLQKYDTGTGTWIDLNRAANQDFTVTIASPAVVSATGHGLIEGNTVKFATTGALPTGITAGTTYYVIATGLTADAFQFSATLGGSAINTSGTQSGTHTMTKLISFTAGAEFGFYVYNDELWGCNAVENYFKWDGATFTEYSTAPKGNVLEVFEDRMFVTGVTAEPLNYYYSDLATPQTFDGASIIKPLGTDFAVTMKNYYGTLMMFKETSIWKLTFVYNETVSLFVPKIELQSNNYGACSKDAVSWVENDLWFFTGREVRAMGFVDNQSGVLGVNKTVLSEPIKETLKDISPSNYSNVSVFYHNRRFYLAVPLLGSTADTTFVCHLLYSNAWTKYTGRTKAKIKDFIVIDDVIYTSVSSGDYGVIKWNETLNDISAAISSEVFFRRIEDKEFNRFRTYRYLDLSFKDLEATVRVTIKQEANDLTTPKTKTFYVGTVEEGEENGIGEVPVGQLLVADSFGEEVVSSPFAKKRVSFLSKAQALIVGLSNANANETFTITQFALMGMEMPKKLFSGKKIISMS